MTAKFNWDSFEDAEQGAAFDWGAYETVKPKKDSAEQAMRKGAIYGTSLVDRALMPLSMQADVLSSPGAQHAEFRKGIFEDIERLAEQKATGVWDDQDEALFKELQEQIKHPEKAEKHVKTVDLHPSHLIRKGIEKATGYDLTPETTGEKVADVLGAFKPKEIWQLGKAGINAARKLKASPQTMESGLSKPRATESKLAKLATIGKETQKKSVDNLNKEAGALIRKSIHKNVPLAKKVEEGFSSTNLSRNFEHLDKAALKSKARLDLEPVEQLMDDYVTKFKGIPSLDPDAKLIQSEIKAWRKPSKTPKTVADAYKTYRSNNRKIRAIDETAFTSGKKADYVNFLKAQNKAIGQSFRDTLGKDAPFVQYFDNLNDQYKKVRRAENAFKTFEPMLRGKDLTPAALEKLAFDPKRQRKLLAETKNPELIQDVIQIAKDLKMAKEAVKGISKSAWKGFEAAFPVTLIIPVVGQVAKSIGIPFYAVKTGRYLLGYWLSKPQTRRAYGDALKALTNHDVEGYKVATSVLRKALESPEEED